MNVQDAVSNLPYSYGTIHKAPLCLNLVFVLLNLIFLVLAFQGRGAWHVMTAIHHHPTNNFSGFRKGGAV